MYLPVFKNPYIISKTQDVAGSLSHLAENDVKKIIIQMLIRRILREKFVENQHCINSYLEYGPSKDEFIRGSSPIYITYSTGRKRGNKSKKRKYLEETKQDFSYQNSIEYERVGFDDETPNETADDKHGFDPEDYNIFKQEKSEDKIDELEEFEEASQDLNEYYNGLSQFGDEDLNNDQTAECVKVEIYNPLKVKQENKGYVKEESTSEIPHLSSEELDDLRLSLFETRHKILKIWLKSEDKYDSCKAHEVFSKTMIDWIISNVRNRVDINNCLDDWDIPFPYERYNK